MDIPTYISYTHHHSKSDWSYHYYSTDRLHIKSHNTLRTLLGKIISIVTRCGWTHEYTHMRRRVPIVQIGKIPWAFYIGKEGIVLSTQALFRGFQNWVPEQIDVVSYRRRER